ncbi:hypothetical protein [Streptomyces purpurogeneiscleroticus]|uniref:hypothetical protein n=1 Tax=Streptomyces purpurogeneiscleroticus TaxID=68259 RepID=UPI001CBDE54F|nr:hypothetical protein [Streptomyces purpurogeneiscleroticus]
MALLVRSLLDPLREWVRTELRTTTDSATNFRMDRFGTALSESDFILPGAVQGGYSPELATELFSDLVNRTPKELETDEEIAFSESDTDTGYFYRLLSPASPYLPSSLGTASRQERIATFSVMKAEAIRIWTKMAIASVTGQLHEFRPAEAQPANWYDKNASTEWKTLNFHVTGNTQFHISTGTTPSRNPQMLWRVPEDRRIGATVAIPPPYRGAPVVYITRIEPKTKECVMTFDACLVRIVRRWLFWPFLNDVTWCVPGFARGELSRPSVSGSISLIPIALLAIRNFRVTADWAEEDIPMANVATHLGPFAIPGEINHGELTHVGLQVVGWLLERLPLLPPNDSPPAA